MLPPPGDPAWLRLSRLGWFVGQSPQPFEKKGTNIFCSCRCATGAGILLLMPEVVNFQPSPPFPNLINTDSACPSSIAIGGSGSRLCTISVKNWLIPFSSSLIMSSLMTSSHGCFTWLQLLDQCTAPAGKETISPYLRKTGVCDLCLLHLTWGCITSQDKQLLQNTNLMIMLHTT